MLRSDRSYEREIVLETNAKRAKFSITIIVKTAPIQNNVAIPPYCIVTQVFLVFTIISGLLVYGLQLILKLNSYELDLLSLPEIIIGHLVSFILVLLCVFAILSINNFKQSLHKAIIVISASIGAYFGTFLSQSAIDVKSRFVSSLVSFGLGIFGFFIGLLIGYQVGKLITHWFLKIIQPSFLKNGYSQRDTLLLLTITLVSSFLTGTGSVIGVNLYILTALATAGLPLAGMLIYPAIKQAKIKAQYRRQESQKFNQSVN